MEISRPFVASRQTVLDRLNAFFLHRLDNLVKLAAIAPFAPVVEQDVVRVNIGFGFRTEPHPRQVLVELLERRRKVRH